MTKAYPIIQLLKLPPDTLIPSVSIRRRNVWLSSCCLQMHHTPLSGPDCTGYFSPAGKGRGFAFVLLSKANDCLVSLRHSAL